MTCSEFMSNAERGIKIMVIIASIAAFAWIIVPGLIVIASGCLLWR